MELSSSDKERIQHQYDALAKKTLVGLIFGHGNSPSLIIVRGGSTPCCRPLIAYQQRRAGLSTTTRSGVHFIVDWLGWLCYCVIKLYPDFDIPLLQSDMK